MANNITSSELSHHTLTTKYPWLLEESESCACEECMEMCNRPCWPLPEEADRLIDLGYAGKMMLDYWVGDGENGGDIDIISPASPGYAGRLAPFWPTKGCVMQNGLGLCKLHDIGKPYEGRMAHHDKDSGSTHHDVAMTWNTEYGRQVVERWKESVDY